MIMINPSQILQFNASSMLLGIHMIDIHDILVSVKNFVILPISIWSEGVTITNIRF